MRSLKFRAWVYYGERLRKPRYSDNDWLCGFFEDCKEDDTDENGKPQCIEQYTGLKDKNGKEIYEGDIVLDYYDGEDTFIVEWDKDTASFILTDTGNISNVSFDNYYSDKDLEVIGNIHENPELLEQEDAESR